MNRRNLRRGKGMLRWMVRMGLAFAVSISVIPVAQAHPLDVAYLDFGHTSSSPLLLTVAVHPYQAFELVRGGSGERFDLKQLQAHGDLITAFVEDHVEVSRDGRSCTWRPSDAHTPDTELDAVADGVTVAGDLACAGTGPLTVTTDLFLEGFPSQTNIVRLEYPNGFADKATLGRTTRSTPLDISPLFTSATPTSTAATEGRRPDAAIVAVAKRALDPGVGIWGFLGILFAAAAIGALHALGPGHGKSLMAATLVGSRATLGRVLALGSVMTLTHVSDVFVMALLAGTIAAIIPPTTLLIWLSLVSAVGLTGLGLFNLWRAVIRYRFVRHDMAFADDDEAHLRAHQLGLPHTHEHAHEHVHEHGSRILNLESRSSGSDDPRSKIPDSSFRHTLWLGFVGSLAPCPTAWAVFMATLASGRLAIGVALLVAFTVGLYATILTVGLLLVASSSFALKRTPARVVYAMPILSALVITGLGVAFLWNLI